MPAYTEYSASEHLVAMYVCGSVLLALLATVLLYVLCSRKYQLNWFEKTRLDGACQNEEEQSILKNEPHLNRILHSHSTGRLESTSSIGSGEFWVPPNIRRQTSFCHGDNLSDFYGEESLPGTPKTPVGSKATPFALSQIGVARQPVKYVHGRPKIASMYTRLDHTQINAELYKKEEEEQPSDNEDPKGNISIVLFYNTQFDILCVTVLECTDLIARDYGGTADPYIKVVLMPDTTSRETSIASNNLNPRFKEEFVFDVPRDKIDSKMVEVLVYDHNPHSRHLCLGSVQIPLKGFNLLEKVKLTKSLSLDETKDQNAGLGELMFSLGFLPSAGRLTVIILKAKNLRPLDESKKFVDPYVKVAIYNRNQRIKKKKTSTHRSTLDPIYNEALNFDLARDVLKEVTIELTVMNETVLGQNEILGRVLLHHNAKGDAGLHITSVLGKRSAVAMWHVLLPPLGA